MPYAGCGMVSKGSLQNHLFYLLNFARMTRCQYGCSCVVEVNAFLSFVLPLPLGICSGGFFTCNCLLVNFLSVKTQLHAPYLPFIFQIFTFTNLPDTRFRSLKIQRDHFAYIFLLAYFLVLTFQYLLFSTYFLVLTLFFWLFLQVSVLRQEPYNLERLFYTQGVDLIIEAHEHSYERLYPLYNGM